MAKPIKAVPEGFHTVTPGFAVRDAARAIEYYKEAFGALEVMRMPGPGGKILHAELKIGDSHVFLSDEFPDMPNAFKAPETLGGTTMGLYLYVKDCDAVCAKAVKLGATPLMPPTDMFWGDRYGQVRDPFGHQWSIATHTKDLTPEEIAKGQADFFSRQAAA